MAMQQAVTDNEFFETHVCSHKHAYLLDNFIRPFIHNPRKMFGPYVKPGMRALDIGCGRGFASLGLAKLVGPDGQVTSADLQPEMLAMVRERIRGTELEPRIVLHRCEPGRVGAVGPFDFILAFWMAHETPDPSAFLDEVYDMLGAEGRFYLVEPGMHVSEQVFRDFVAEAEGKGFTVKAMPRVRLSRAAVLKKEV